MQIIVNATFLINVIRTDAGMLEKRNLVTTGGIAMEVENELGVKLDVALLKAEMGGASIPEDKKGLLSDSDINLLNLSFERKDSCILVTDDKQLRKVAKSNGIKCLTTPLFMTFLLRRGEISRERCASFLNLLRDTYIRKRDVEKVLRRIEGW